ncbi:MBL fold metallo-hydrolase [Ferrovibrio sp.]|uniref:MBL fold metallo-hydrolase n=1 Tax=Ferrovibrio sp. TaxID=1917215 RepID=UPI0026067C72|nr:MBL fold metallo-hydrolase [Ferrovibrio sp.]
MSATLSFHGAAGVVTGSCYRLQLGNRSILVDCGMFQGDKTLKELNYGAWPFDPRHIDAVLLTHAHIDHSGLIPKLVKAGFTGPVLTTEGSADLLQYMLPDSGGIQEMEVERLNRRNQRRGRGIVQPIYTEQDAVASLKLIAARDYETWFEVIPGIEARLWNAGHILGAASIELKVANGEHEPLRLLFSGDIGPEHKALQQSAEAPSDLDVVVMESTYGGRPRPKLDPQQRRAVLAGEVNEALKAGGNLVIPAFAVERTQELLADLIKLMADGDMQRVPIFVDSPLALHITEVFARHFHHEKDMQAATMASNGGNLHFTRSVQESMQIEQVTGGAIIIAASGMCEAGRIRHHLKNNLWRPNATVLLIGYMAPGTLGALLEQGEKAVRIQGDELEVRARIRKLEIYSGHADHDELLDWLKDRLPIRRGLMLTHGEPDSVGALRAAIALWDKSKLPLGQLPQVYAPRLDELYALNHPHPKLLKTPQVQKRLDRYAEAEALSGHDWHNDYARLMLQVQAELRGAKSDVERRRLLKKLQRVLGR